MGNIFALLELCQYRIRRYLLPTWEHERQLKQFRLIIRHIINYLTGRSSCASGNFLQYNFSNQLSGGKHLCATRAMHVPYYYKVPTTYLGTTLTTVETVLTNYCTYYKLFDRPITFYKWQFPTLLFFKSIVAWETSLRYYKSHACTVLDGSYYLLPGNMNDS